MKTNERFDTNTRGLKGTFVGTPLYVAPEMLEFNSSGSFTDLWALGCIIYEMLVGKSPFYAKNSNLVFQKILERNIQYPPEIDKTARNLIDRLLEPNPTDRLGVNGYKELKTHPFFEDLDFEHLENREMEVPGIDTFLNKC